MIRRFLFSVFLFVFVSFLTNINAEKSNQPKLSFARMLQLVENGSLAETTRELQRAQVALEVARGVMRHAPSVDWSAGVSNTWPLSEEARSDFGVTQQVDVRLALFKGYATVYAGQEAKIRAQKRAADHTIERLARAKLGGAAFIKWHFEQEKLSLLAVLVKLRQKNLKEVLARIKNGELSEQDAWLFEAQLLESEDRIASSQLLIESQLQVIEGLAGHPIAELREAKVDLPHFIEDGNKTVCEADANVDPHFLRAQKLGAALADLGVARAGTTLWPHADLVTRARWASASGGDVRIALNFKWNLFDGLKTRNDIAKAANQSATERHRLLSRRETLTIDLRAICHRWATLQRRALLLDRLVDRYRQTQMVIQRQFRLGAVSTDERILAESRWIAARLTRIQMHRERSLVKLAWVHLQQPDILLTQLR